jgi:hypothetical protein
MSTSANTASTESHLEDGVTPINPVWLQQQAREWAEMLAASSKPFVTIDDMHAWGGPHTYSPNPAPAAVGDFLSAMGSPGPDERGLFFARL